MKITALIEDTTMNSDLNSEKGLSLHIEREQDNILFDTGVSGNFTDNANKSGIDLKKVDVTAISHGHFDHGGGLRRFLELNETSPVYIHIHSEEEHYFKGFMFIKRDIGMDKTLFSDYSDRIKFIKGLKEISRDVYLIDDIKINQTIPKGSKYLYKKVENQLIHDDFKHEQMMVIREDDGLVIFSGCSHHGVLNMVEAAMDQFPNIPIKGLFGGFHFIGLPFFNHMAESKRNVEDIGKKLLEYPIEKVYTGHCTGRKAYPILKNVMGDRVEYFATGCSVEI
jgi:7,8-dihydropterin-6-yl-methyl-4-(beta-D-ribofuranosyl)aminobenzene 5'-phosphate synthase